MKRIFTKLRRSFFAGLLIILPVTITMVILNFLYRLIIIPITYRIRPLIFFISPEGIDEILRRYIYLWDIFSILLLVFGIALVGVIARSSIIARWLIRSGERFLARLPLINKIYSAIQQISQAILGEKKSSFKKAVLLEYPRKGLWCIGLVSNDIISGEVQKKTEKKMISVFLPTTPNPTSGLYVLMPEEDTIPLKMSIDEALTMIVSVGVVTPPDDEETGKRPWRPE
ncbi:DUF502 domain-containing protein [candidate division NPL-UPA2 bacterium Unc8]|uniref:DUF502 domain-containing protein n=1 Tax=candidate division NPL-UPA2 bacterium Unc8 TaxID=1980939 RepID=A0A399G0T6_UNCN2|nr:MAG: DUF502 domain-containing protein [candidate division NPL-UPA2 bacterium Unc8]